MSYASDRPYPLQGATAPPLVGAYSMLGTAFRWVRWTVSLCVLVLIVHLVCAMLIWEDGSETMVRLVATERQNLGLDAGTTAGRTVDSVMVNVHEWAFVKTGFEDWARAQRSGLLSAFMSSLWFAVDAAVQGLQLFALRIAVLLLSLPLFLAVAAAAMADGVYGWLIRRSAGARESGFIYHRAKRALPSILGLIWLVYLVPPVAMDPRWVLPSFVMLFAIALRFRVAYFKKHL